MLQAAARLAGSYAASGKASAATFSASARSSAPLLRPSRKRCGMPLSPTMDPTIAPTGRKGVTALMGDCLAVR